MKILHLVGLPPYQTNCFVLIGSEGRSIVIDPAVSATRINKVLQEHTATLSMILLTHGHFDHVTSAEQLQKDWRCPVYLDPADHRKNEIYPFLGESCPYEEGRTIDLDDIHITCWHLPGHSEGSWVLCCENVMFSGDTLFAGSVGRTDLEGGSSAQQRQSLIRLKSLPIDPAIQVLPGHGSFSTLETEFETNPFLMF